MLHQSIPFTNRSLYSPSVVGVCTSHHLITELRSSCTIRVILEVKAAERISFTEQRLEY